MKKEKIPEGWEKIKLKEVLKEVNIRNKDEKIKRVLSVTNSQGFVNQEEYFEGTVHSENISNYKIVRKNQFAYNPSRINVGSIDILEKYAEGALSPMYVVFKVDETRLIPEYFKYYFKTYNFLESVKSNTQGTVRESLSFDSLKEFIYLLPPIKEQEKIIRIFQIIDSVLIKGKEELDYIQREKKIIFNKIINRKVTLKNKNGKKYEEWKEKKLGDFINIYNTKTSDKNKYPLYSLTIEEGVVKKSERYEREFLVKKESDMYKIVPPLAFVYNPMNVRFGAVKVNHETFPVAVSGYYDVFFLGDEKTVNFWENYLVSEQMLRYYNVISTGTLVEKQRVHFSKFVEIKRFLPSYEEQKVISNCLKKYDNVIERKLNKYNHFLNLRKALMQQLLTGKVRVKI